MGMSQLVTFGETMVRLSTAPGERLETAEQLAFRIGGAESNVAIAAQRLGTETTWTSKLPYSPLGRRVTGEIQSHGVQTDVVWDRRDEARQGAYYLEYGSAPRGTSVIYDRANASVTTATAAELPTGTIREADVFFTTGITPALSETLSETVTDLLTTARNGGTTTAFDLNYRSKLWTPEAARSAYESLFEHIDLLFVPERDAHEVLDLDGSARDIARSLASTHDVETVIVTRGEEGALALDGDTVVEQPTYETETVDPIGTGDAFVGGFLTEWIADASIETALETGAATAALKRTIDGDLAVVTPEEVAAVRDSDGSAIDR